MSNPDDHDEATKPKFTPTALDPASPFDSTTLRSPVLPRETQLSDPPTALVRRDPFVDLPSGTVVGDVYEISARLGGGAMGEVYAAQHIKLGKRVAIKVISEKLSQDAAAIERFAMEAKTLANVQHPAIVAVDHVGELADGRAFFVMELLRGESLFDHLQRGRMRLPEALRVLDQMARGLEAAHGQGVIHRDLKPENTFLVHLAGEESAVKLLDFGLAKLRTTDDRRAERTQSGVAIGTPMYMSPEQMRGPDVDHRTDIYALGCVAYEMVLGRSPFPHAKTAPELYAAHLHEPPPPPRSIWPEIPPQLDLVLFAMLAKDPAYRPTLAQFRSVIADVRTGTPSQRAETEFVGQRAVPPKTWTPAIGLLTMVVGILLGVIVTKTASRHATNPPIADAQPSITPIITPSEAEPPPQVEPITPAKENPAPPPRSRSRGSDHQAAGSAVARTPKTVTVTSLPPVDAGIIIDAPVETPEVTPLPKPKGPPWTDRNQTINPFPKRKTP